MKKALIVLLISAIAISSCQKELNFDIPNTATGNLMFDTITGDCQPSLVAGIYKKDSTLTASNYIELQLNVTTAGNYSIHTDTINGYSFSAEGTFSNPGIKTVRLTGSGEPLAFGINTFPVLFGSSVCMVDVSVLDSADATAVYTLGQTQGICTDVVIEGTYIVNTPLTGSNHISVTVDVSSPGAYVMGASSLNGMFFTGTGIFTNTGIQTVTLNGVGTPSSPGSTLVTVSSGISTCTFPLTVISGNNNPATYTVGSGGSCAGTSVTGAYTAGIIVPAGNTATIDVDVTTTGSYSITTAPVNGIMFSGTGIFTTTGIQPVVLTASGTPFTTGTHSFIVTGSGSTCSFDVTTNNSGGSSGILTCKLDGVFKTFNINARGIITTPSSFFGEALQVDGFNAAGSVESFYIYLNNTVAGNMVVPGTYGQGQPTKIVQFRYTPPPGGGSWYGISTTAPNILTVSTVTATRVTGTFSGRLNDNNGSGTGVKIITEGTFDVPRQ